MNKFFECAVLIAVFTAVIVFTIGVNARIFLTEKEVHQELSEFVIF